MDFKIEERHSLEYCNSAPMSCLHYNVCYEIYFVFGVLLLFSNCDNGFNFNFYIIAKLVSPKSLQPVSSRIQVSASVSTSPTLVPSIQLYSSATTNFTLSFNTNFLAIFNTSSPTSPSQFRH